MDNLERLIEANKELAEVVEKSNKRLFIIIISFVIATIFFFYFYFNYSWKTEQTVKNGEITQQMKSGG